MSKFFKRLLPASIGILSLYFILWYFSSVLGWINGGSYLDLIRWLGELCLIVYAIKRNNLTIWIFTSMFIGAEIGLYLPEMAGNGKILSKIFLRCIKTIIAPLLFATLVVGIAGHSDLRQVGRMGLKALIYFELVTTVALFIGLAVVNITKPGADFIKPNTIKEEVIPASAKTWQDHVVEIFPENVAKSIADGAILQVVIFSILFGIGLAMVKESKKKPMIEFCESLSEVMFKFTNIVMLFAPFAVGGAIAASVGSMGMDIFLPLAKLVGSLYLGLLIFVFGVLLPIALFIKVPI
ncbi:MAG: dicarboxylate/amino acid:cation symporter, partial [Bacteroidia bacterium]